MGNIAQFHTVPRPLTGLILTLNYHENISSVAIICVCLYGWMFVLLWLINFELLGEVSFSFKVQDCVEIFAVKRKSFIKEACNLTNIYIWRCIKCHGM
jgi:hypothetical protein